MKLSHYLSKYMELGALHEFVKRDFSAKQLVHHNWNHVLRDLARGVVIGEAEGADMKIVLAGVLLHDIGRLYPERGEDHHVSGGEIARKYLAKVGFKEGETEEVNHCIRAHGPRGLEEPRTLEAKACYDVDVLSCSCGNVGVARVFHYFIAEEKFTVKQMMEIESGRKGPRKSFYTETGRKLGQKGYLKAARFWKELAGELVQEEQQTKRIIPDYEGD